MAERKQRQKPKAVPAEPPAAPGAGEDELAQRAAALDEREGKLQERDSELDARQAALDERQTQLEHGEAAAAEAAAAAGKGEEPAPASSGQLVNVTYLGRPELIRHGDDGEPLEEDVYQGTDAWSDDKPLHLAVGESALVSAEKAAQLQTDFPGAFETS